MKYQSLPRCRTQVRVFAPDPADIVSQKDIFAKLRKVACKFDHGERILAALWNEESYIGKGRLKKSRVAKSVGCTLKVLDDLLVELRLHCPEMGDEDGSVFVRDKA